MKKVIAAGIAAAGIAGGSVAVAAIAPFGSALAQDSGSTTTTTTPPSDTTPRPTKSSIFDDALKSLVDDGTLTQEQADKVKSRVQEKAQAARAANPEPHFKGGVVGESLDKIAGVLGISVDDLTTQLKSGKTLGEIAGDKKPALITALTDAANARIDEAVKNGKLTEAQGADLKSKTADRITKLVDEGFKFGHRGPR